MTLSRTAKYLRNYYFLDFVGLRSL